MDIDTQRKWTEKTILAINAALPDQEIAFKNWQHYDRLLSSALACLQWIIDLSITQPEAGLLLNQIAFYLQEAKGDYHQAEPLYQQTLAIWKKTLGYNHRDVATCLNNLAGLYFTKANMNRPNLVTNAVWRLEKRFLANNIQKLQPA